MLTLPSVAMLTALLMDIVSITAPPAISSGIPGCRPGHDCGDAGYRPDDHADPAENLFEDIEDTFGFHGVEAIHDLFQLLLVDLGALFSLGVDGGHAVFGGLRARLVADHLGQRFEREPSRRGRGQPRQV